MPHNAAIFRVYLHYHKLKYYAIKLTAKFYIDTMNQMTKIRSIYVLNRIAIGTVSTGTKVTIRLMNVGLRLKYMQTQDVESMLF